MNAVAQTSIDALEDANIKAPGYKQQILDTLGKPEYTHGLTRCELARLLNMHEITAGSRLTELRKTGQVKRTEETRLSSAGKAEYVYTLGNDMWSIPPKVKKPERSVSQMVEFLTRLGVTSSDVMGEIAWFDQPEGASYWEGVYVTLVKIESEQDGN